MLMPNDKYWEAISMRGDKYLKDIAAKVGIPPIMCSNPSFMSEFKLYVEYFSRWSVSEAAFHPLSEAEINSIVMKVQPNIRVVQGKVDDEAMKRENLHNIQNRSTISIMYDPQLGPNAPPSVVFDNYDREPIGNGERHTQSIYEVDSPNTVVNKFTSKVKDEFLSRTITRSDNDGKTLDTTHISYDPKSGKPKQLNHTNSFGEVDYGESYTDGRLESSFHIKNLDGRTVDTTSKKYDVSGRVVSTKVSRAVDNVVRYEATSRIDRNGNVIDVCEDNYRPNGTLSTKKLRDFSGAIISSGVYEADGISNVTEEYYRSGAIKSRTSFSKDEKNRIQIEKRSFDESGKCDEHFMEKVVDGRIRAKAVEHFENGKSVGADYTEYMEDGRPGVVKSYYPSKRIKSSISYKYPDERTVSYSGYGYAENGAKKTFTRGQVIDGIKKEAITQLDEKGNAIGVKFLNYDANGNIIENSPERSDGMAQAME